MQLPTTYIVIVYILRKLLIPKYLYTKESFPSHVSAFEDWSYKYLYLIFSQKVPHGYSASEHTKRQVPTQHRESVATIPHRRNVDLINDFGIGTSRTLRTGVINIFT
jgi:hypothetical protein